MGTTHKWLLPNARADEANGRSCPLRAAPKGSVTGQDAISAGVASPADEGASMTVGLPVGVTGAHPTVARPSSRESADLFTRQLVETRISSALVLHRAAASGSPRPQ